MRKLFALAVVTAVAMQPLGSLAQETALLSMGQLVDLELIHHVNSKHSEPGSSLYFRVVNDILSKDDVVVRAGAVVRGTMADAKKNKAFGRAGKLGIVLGNVLAIDGTSVPLDREIERKGRTRYGAATVSIVTLGVFGLFAKGRAAFLEKGELFSVRIAADRQIELGAPEPAEENLPAPDLSISLQPTRPLYVLKIEKKEKIKPVQFRVTGGENPGLSDLRLVSVDGMVLPEPLLATAPLIFDGWSLLSYCPDGRSELEFRATARDGKSVAAVATLNLEIKRKGKEEDPSRG